MMYARSVTDRVSRTLWSVTSTPIPFFFSAKMISCNSSTAIGSMPENGSSSRINAGSMARQRAISTLRRSPPLNA